MIGARRLCALLFVLACSCLPVHGQAATGTPPFGSFGGGTDVINLANLNAHLTVPVLNKTGRGMPFSYNLAYDSSIWVPVTASGTTSWQPVANYGWNADTQAPLGKLTFTTVVTVCNVGHTVGLSTVLSNYAYHDSFGSAHSFPGTRTIKTGACGTVDIPLNATTSDGSGYSVSVSSAGTSVTARTGKLVSISGNGITDANGNEISFSTTTGAFTDTLGQTALTVSQSAPGPTTPTTFTYVAPFGGNAAFTMKYANYTLLTNFGCAGIAEYSAANVPLVSEIDLPDGTGYLFAYEPTPSHAGYVTGRLASVTLPTGGVINYSYTGGNNGIECSDGSTTGLTRTTPDGAWTYSRILGTAPASTTTVTDPQSNQTVVDFQGIFETERKINQGATSLLKTIFTCYNGAVPNCNGNAITFPISSVAQYTQWPGGMESEIKATYNSYGLVVEKDEYAYGPTAPGAIVRKTLTTYAALGNGIVSKPATITVEDGSSIIKSQTTYTYDEPGTLTNTTGTPQHAAVSGSRGNATTISSLVGSTSLSKHFTYYDTGNLNTAKDVNLSTTTYTYGTGSCGNSFVTAVSEPMSLARSMTWNCIGGVQTSLVDENGNSTSNSYTTDPGFWRPNSTTDAASNLTAYAYTDATQAETTTLFNSGASSVDVLTKNDSLGRRQLSQIKQTPSATTYDSVETGYDALGRPNMITLPYSGTAGQLMPTAPGGATGYDALGRKASMTDSGGMNATFTYTNNDTYRSLGPAPTGENAKRKQFEYDALGRLTSVCEVSGSTGSGACAQTTPATGFRTTYSYDVLNDLTTVSQNAQSTGSIQTRTYAYDNLRRMTSETNPESGMTNYTYDTDATCASTSAGDLVKKVDAVGNTTCFSYDALHRQTLVMFSGPYSAATPTRYFAYDSATVNSVVMVNAKGRLAEAYTCTGTCTTKGTDVGFSYTSLGQASDVYEMTHTSGTYYHVTSSYWANGAVNQIKNLTGLPTITYGVDGEGRIYSASTSSGQNPLTSTTYNPAGEPLTVTLGSLDSDTFTYDPETDRTTKYQFSVNGQSVVGQLTWNSIGTLGGLVVTDAFFAGNNQTCGYTHDDLARIASANCGTPWSQTFDYDAFGNLRKSGTMSFLPTYSYATNRMTMIGSSAPGYDANGNVTNDFLHTYAWDAMGKAVTIDGVILTYDALGRMVEQNRSGTVTEIIYGPSGAKLAVMNGTTLQKAFVALPGGSLAVYNSSGLAYYRHSDWLGSSRFASTPARGLYSDGAYGPFGEVYAQSGSSDASFTAINQDTVANLYDFPAREYGTQGRWPSPDPSGSASTTAADPQSWNRYAYAVNSPMGSADPTGMFAIPRMANGLTSFGAGGLLSMAAAMGFGGGPAIPGGTDGGVLQDVSAIPMGGQCLVLSSGGNSAALNLSASKDACGNIANGGNGSVGVWVNGSIQGAGYSSNGLLAVTYNGQGGNATYGTFDPSAGTFTDGLGTVTYDQNSYFSSDAAALADAMNATGIQSVANPCSIVLVGVASGLGGAISAEGAFASAEGVASQYWPSALGLTTSYLYSQSAAGRPAFTFLAPIANFVKNSAVKGADAIKQGCNQLQ